MWLKSICYGSETSLIKLEIHLSMRMWTVKLNNNLKNSYLLYFKQR